MRSLLLLLLILVVAGCGMERPHPDKAYFTMPSPRLEPLGARHATISTLRVSRARIAQPFRARALQYRVGPQQFQGDYYNNWASDPGLLIAIATIESIMQAGTFDAVVGESSTAVPDAVLEMSVTGLYVDRTSAAPETVIRLRAVVLDPERSILMLEDYEARTATASLAPADVVTAFGTTLETILTDLAVDLAAVDHAAAPDHPAADRAG